MKKKINVALIGYGFMGRAHSNAYLKVNRFFDIGLEPVLKVVSARNEENLRKFAARWGWQDYETDWRKVIERNDIDLVDICTPNYTHYPIAMAAAREGKMIACEKPLAINAQEAREMTAAVEKTGKPNMVWFNYRRVPAIALAKKIIDEERLGRVFHYRAKYLQDWTISSDVALGGRTLWRLDKKAAGSGVTGDLLSHSIDLSIWLNGKISTVCAMTETFVKEREMQDEPGRKAAVEIDDACALLARFDNGSMGTFECTRFSRGRKNQHTFEINGERASVAFDLENAHELAFFDSGDESHIRGWHKIQVWDSDHPYMAQWWVPGCVIGYEHTFINALADFFSGIEKEEKNCPDFRDALYSQIVCDAVLSSAQSHRWEAITF